MKNQDDAPEDESGIDKLSRFLNDLALIADILMVMLKQQK